MAVYESPGAGRVLIASGDALAAEPTWTRYDNLGSHCRCYGFDWTRGRSSELDVTDTGTARVYFHDRDQTLNDDDLVGLQIMLQLYDPVADAWEPVFRGHIDDVHEELNPNAVISNVTIECVDIFAYLGSVRMVLGTFGAPVPEGMKGVVFYEDGPVATGTNDPTDGGRIELLLEDAHIDPDMYVAFSGNVDVQETQYGADDNILSALRDAADAEFPGIANVYVDRFGRVVFHGRFARFDPDTTAAGAATGAWDFTRWEAGTRGDVGTDKAQIREFSYNRPNDRVINVYVAYPRGIDENQVYNLQWDFSSGGAVRAREAPDIIVKQHKTNGNTGADECILYGKFYVTNYGEPKKNVERITFKSVRPYQPNAAKTWELMSRMDISDIIHLTIAEAGLSAEPFYIEGISGECRVGNARYDFVTVTPNLSPFAYYTDNVFEG